jgi:hypothetical protein
LPETSCPFVLIRWYQLQIWRFCASSCPKTAPLTILVSICAGWKNSANGPVLKPDPS